MPVSRVKPWLVPTGTCAPQGMLLYPACTEYNHFFNNYRGDNLSYRLYIHRRVYQRLFYNYAGTSEISYMLYCSHHFLNTGWTKKKKKVYISQNW